MTEYACGILLALVSCARQPPPRGDGASGSIEAACHLVGRRCSRCHTLDRVLQARIDRAQWPDYIHRMRLMPGSGILAPEERVLARCLVYRSPTGSGMELLAREVPR